MKISPIIIKFAKLLPQRQNFAKSGHTAQGRGI